MALGFFGASESLENSSHFPSDHGSFEKKPALEKVRKVKLTSVAKPKLEAVLMTERASRDISYWSQSGNEKS
jgi:hypothetical protein